LCGTWIHPGWILIVKVAACEHATTADARRLAGGEGAVNDATAALARDLKPAIFAAAPCLNVGPDAADLPLLLAAWVVASGRVAAIHAAVASKEPARGAQQLQLRLLSGAELHGILAVQVATAAREPAKPEARRVAGRALHMGERAAALVGAREATITIKTVGRLAAAGTAAAFADVEAAPLVEGT